MANLLKTISLCIVSLLFLQCDMSMPTALTPAEFDARARSLSEFTQPEELPEPVHTDDEVEPSTESKTVTEPGGTVRTNVYSCTTREYMAAPGYNELFLLNPSFDTIYPGSVIDGASIPDGRYAQITAPRRPLRISTSISGAAGVSATVPNPTLSGVRDAIAPLLTPANTMGLMPPANSVLSIKESHSLEQFGLEIGVDIDAQITTTIMARPR